jgi:hypothetical protein
VRPFIQRFAGVAGASLASQLAAACAVLSVTLLGPRVVDAYAIGLQMGTATFAGYSIGVIYNINLGRQHLGGWGKAKWGAVGSAAVLGITVLTFIELASIADIDPVVIAAYTIGSAGLGVAGVRAAQQACAGQPFPLATTTIPANVAMSAVAVVVQDWHGDQSRLFKVFSALVGCTSTSNPSLKAARGTRIPLVT